MVSEVSGLSEKYPRVVEKYRGVDIWYNPVTGKYQANHCEHVKRDKDINVVKRWLDRWWM